MSLPAAPGDNIGIQVVVTDATLSGIKSAATPLMIADGSITSAKIPGGTVASVHLASNAVNSSKISNGTILEEDLNKDAITSEKKLTGSIPVDTTQRDLRTGFASGPFFFENVVNCLRW